MSAITILPYLPGDAPACAEILAALPDWFGIAEANAEFLRNLAEMPSWLAHLDGRPIGAATLRQYYPSSFEIHFLAVHPAFHRRGIGRALVEHLERQARGQGGDWLHVKTLAPSHPDSFYARTRAFYTALCFSPLFETDALWGPENPAVIMIKPLG